MADTLLTIDGSNYIGKVIEKDAKRQLIVFDDGKNVFGFSLNVVKSIIYTDGATWLNPHTSASITNKSVSAMPNRTKGIGNYQILYHNKTETSSYAQVEYHLLISPYISRSELESILLETLNLSKEAEFKQHEQTTQVYIYVFTSEKRYKRSANPYVAHLNWNIRMSEVQLEIKDDLLGRELPEYPTIAMASNEQEQHHIFQEIIAAEVIAFNDTKRKFDIAEGERLTEEAAIYRQERELELKARVAKKYQLNEFQIEEIKAEGKRRNWEITNSKQYQLSLNSNTYKPTNTEDEIKDEIEMPESVDDDELPSEGPTDVK